MTEQKTVKGKIISNLSSKHREIMYAIVNHTTIKAPGNQGGISKVEGARRMSLFKKITGDNPEYDFDSMDGYDFIITNAEWDILKQVFENANYVSQEAYINGSEIEELILNAETVDVPV